MSEWVSIGTTPCPLHTTILVTDGNGKFAFASSHLDRNPLHLSPIGFSGYEWDLDSATHWMHIPPLTEGYV